MTEKSRVLNIFKVTIDDFRKEYDDLKQKADAIDFQLQEKIRYLDTFVKKEESDFKLFSPRDVESVHREEIEEKENEIAVLETEKNALFQKMGYLSSHINKLSIVYESISEWDKDDVQEFSDEKEEIKYLESYDKIKDEPLAYRVMITDIVEKDRQRLARELHDSTIQDLTHTIHVLELAEKFSDKDLPRTKMELMSAQKNLREIIENLRNIVFDLRPMSIDDLGLGATFERLKYHIEKMSDLRVKFDIDDKIESVNIDTIILYQIIKELCMNVVKHAKASKIDVSLKILNDIVMLKVADDGIGFEYDYTEKQQKTSFGLEMTKERVNLLNGKMKVVSEKDIGTSIIISFHVLESKDV